MTYEINLEAEVRFACKGDKQWAFMAKKKKKASRQTSTDIQSWIENILEAPMM